MRLRVTLCFEFEDKHIERARIWARSRRHSYMDDRLLMADAMQAGIYQFEHVRLAKAVAKEVS